MKILIMILFSFLTFTIKAQSFDINTVGANIKNILFSETKIDYLIYAIDFNDAKEKGEIEISDKNNLLTDCYLFIAKDTSINARIMVGIFKNDLIIWKTQPVIEGTLVNDFSFWKILDLKNTGDVDILIKTNPYCGKIYCMNLWVVDWNGYSGEIINQYYNGNSEIFTEAEEFELVNVDGDGIWEILGQKIISSEFDESTEEEKIKTQTILYTWNGNKIGNYGISLPNFLPRNNLNADVKTKVKKRNEYYSYIYNIYNHLNSLQSIENFSINSHIDTVNNFQTPSDWRFLNRNDSSLLYFGWNPSSERENFIQPGKKEVKFVITTKHVPSIVKYFVQGNNGGLNYYVSRIADNSIYGYTIGPKIILSFNNIDYIDSLLNYCTRSLQLDWIKNQPTANKYTNYFTTAKSQFQQNNIAAAKNTLNQVLHDVDIDSTANLTSEAYALLRYNTEYLLDNLPETTAGFAVRLTNSSGNLLTGGSLKYYEGGWKDAVDNGDGTFSISTDRSSLSLRMNYEYGSQTVSNVPAQNNTYTFHTVNTTVQLKNSSGTLINEEGTVKYYAGGWRDFGTIENGIASKELLPNNYSFRIIYSYSSNDKKQDISTNPNVVFQTAKATVQLQNSQNQLIDEGKVKYYAGGWRDFGSTLNGTVSKELLPNNYSFRMTYAYSSNDKQQDIGTDATVIFRTVNASVQLQNSQGQLIDEGTVKYYAGGWKDLGTTEKGIASKELLPNNYSFRMTYADASNDKQQNIGDNPTVVFQTVNASIQLKNSQGQFIDEGEVKYYAGGWRDFGTTVNGTALKELLPNNYSFRMTYAYASYDKQQNIGDNSNVVFQTVNASVQLKNSQDQFIDEGTVKYYGGGWRDFGSTSNGIISKELLPNNYSFRMNHEYISNDKQQNIGANNVVVFSTILCRVKVTNSQNQPINSADIKYYAGGWRQFGTTSNGEAAKELLPSNITFRGTYSGVSRDKQQNTGENPVIEIYLP